jgi:hypothetical protein
MLLTLLINAVYCHWVSRFLTPKKTGDLFLKKTQEKDITKPSKLVFKQQLA